MKKHFMFLLILFSILTFLNSCVSSKKMTYYQNIDQISKGAEIKNYDSVLQNDDLLMIVVTAENPEAAMPFNLVTANVQINTDNAIGQPRLMNYLIDTNGEIDFPVIGKIKLSGKTPLEAVDFLNKELSKYIKKPSVLIRVLNYKVSVQGEVNRPGTFTIQNQRITLLEAISLAGDLTIYGKRNNILVIREENGKISTSRIDITKADFIKGPFYYLKQNDVIYVEPNKTKVNSSVIGPNISTAMSAISLLITIIALTTRK